MQPSVAFHKHSLEVLHQIHVVNFDSSLHLDDYLLELFTKLTLGTFSFALAEALLQVVVYLKGLVQLIPVGLDLGP